MGCFFFTVVLTTAVYGFLIWLGARKLLRHLRRHPEAMKAVVDNVILPLFKPEEKAEPEVKKIKGTPA